MLVGTAAWASLWVRKEGKPGCRRAGDSALHWVANLVPFGADLYEYLLRPFLIYWELAVIAVALLVIFLCFQQVCPIEIAARLRRVLAQKVV